MMPDSYIQLLHHVVFATKGRRPWIAPGLREPLYAYIDGIVQRHRGGICAIGGMPDHIHLLIRMPSDPGTATLVRAIKANSSRWAAERRPGFRWQRNYAAFSVSHSAMDDVARYIHRQEEHHRKFDFDRELQLLLERHGLGPEPSSSAAPLSAAPRSGGSGRRVADGPEAHASG
jgi:putative transposase